MGLRFFFPFLLVISTQTLFQCVESLQCYQCIYYEGISDRDMEVSPKERTELFDSSCKGVPNSKYLQECDDGTLCNSNIFEGYLDSDKNSKVKIFEKRCIGANTVKSKKDDCEHFKSFDEFHNIEEGLQPNRRSFEHKLSSNTALTWCTCKKDGCNSSNNTSTFSRVGFWFVFMIAGFFIKLI